MTINEPTVIVQDVEKIAERPYGNAGKIALIGVFPSTDSATAVDVYTTLDSAQSKLKGSATASQLESNVAYGCLPYIFAQGTQSKGAEQVLIVNLSAIVENATLSNNTLATALNLLAEEDFDILTIADAIALGTEGTLNTMWTTLHTFAKEMYANQKPFGIITGVTLPAQSDETGVAMATAFKTLFEDKGIYKAVTTPVILKGETDALSIAQSGCWHSSFTAGRTVNRSETAKVYEDIIGQDTKSLYPIIEATTKLDWEKLVDNGFHTTKYRNRRTNTIECITNLTPTKNADGSLRDMKIERVKNYIVKRLALRDVLGEDNTDITLGYVKGLFEYEKKLAIQNNYLTDMEYNILQCSSKCIQCELALEIADVVRTVKLNVSLEITPFEEA